ncbi:MAG: ABC transporter permease [Clostridiales bacterium]|nr:ABC transporter permease [Clostridiales bacterium]
MKYKGYLSGWSTVFGFTLRNQISKKSYVALTAVIAVLIIAGVAALIIIPRAQEPIEPTLTEASLELVTVCDLTGEFGDVSWLASDAGFFGDVEYRNSSLLPDDALEGAGDYEVVLIIMRPGDSYELEIVSSRGTKLPDAEVNLFTSYVTGMFRAELMRRSGIDPSLLPDLSVNIETPEPVQSTPEADSDRVEGARETINMVMSYITIFIIYILVMFYGQGAATTVILEKTSKLMDFFLVAVKPEAMILGKVLAAAAAGFIQFAVWVLSGFLGFRLGVGVVRSFFPDSEIIALIENLSGFKGIFTPAGLLIALLMLVVGFLLYCSLAAIGGAMASKPEDLASTNLIFTLSVVASFLLAMYAGGTSGMVSTAGWLIYFPFTAILVTPGRAMAGIITIPEGIISIGLVAILAFICVIIAGRIYEMMSFYRGNPPTPAKMVRILRDSLRSDRADNRYS